MVGGPKAQNKPAQGSALGKTPPQEQSPEGAESSEAGSGCAAPLGLHPVGPFTQAGARSSLDLGWLVQGLWPNFLDAK